MLLPLNSAWNFSLWLHKNIDGIEASAQRIIQAMKTTALSRKTIRELFIPDKLPELVASYQLCFGFLS